MASILEIILKSSGGDSVKSELGKVSTGADTATKLFNALGNMLSVGVLAKGIKDCIIEFGRAEQATVKLNSALRNQGIVGESTGKAFIKQAEDLMELTTFTHEAITEGQALAMNMGVQADTIKQITPLVLDFASAMGMDLETAFRIVGKAALGENDMLKRYGIIVDEDKLKTDGFNAVLETLQKHVSGTAELLAKSGTGQLKQFRNNVDELKEAVGEGLVPVLATLSQIILNLGKDLTGTNKHTEEQATREKKVHNILVDQNTTQQQRVQLMRAVKEQNGEMMDVIIKNYDKEEEKIKIHVKLSEEEQKKLKKIREEEAKALDEKVEKSKDKIEKEYDLRRNLGELDLKSVIENLEERFAQEELGTEKSKALFQALSDYKNALGIDDAARIKEIQDSISSNLETNLGDMLMGQKTWSEATSGIWDNLHRMIIDMILKETIETKAAAVVKIAAEQAVIAAKAMSAYVGIPFVGIALGLGAIAMVANEINKHTFQGGGTVPGAEGTPVQATVHGGERILTPQQQRMGIGSGINIGRIEIIFPEVTSFSDWMNASPAIIKQVTEKKILQALSSLEDEGKVKEGTVLI